MIPFCPCARCIFTISLISHVYLSFVCIIRFFTFSIYRFVFTLFVKFTISRSEKADTLLNKKDSGSDVDGLLASSQGIANKVLDDPDFSFIKALQTAQQNFVVTDPSLPDNPIVYSSQGFLNLTGYSLDQILGRNCRFLQGPETDPKAVERIRTAIEQGNDMSVCLLNYRVDGTTFWNQFFIAALRDANGEVTNFVGVQCKVSDQYAATVTKQQEEEDADAE